MLAETRVAALVLLTAGLSVALGDRLGADDLQAFPRGGDAVVRRVGELEIRASDVFHLMDIASPAQTAEAIDELVLRALVTQAARAEGVDVSSAAVETELERTLSEQKARFAVEVQGDVTLEEFVAQRHGWTPDEFRRVVRRGVLENMLLDRVVRLHTFRTPRDELQIILVEDQSVAEEIAAKVAEGASFSVLARNHSVHPSGQEGGFMPPLPADIDVPLVAGREALAPGGLIGPAPITLGAKDYWRLIRLADRQPGRLEAWSQLAPEVEADLIEQPIHPDELTLFEAAMADRYRVEDSRSTP